MSLDPAARATGIWGAELSVDWSATEKVEVRTALTWQRGEIFNEDLGREVEHSTDTMAPLRLTGFVGYAPSELWRFGMQATYYGEVDFFSQAEQALGFVNTDSQFLLDANLSVSLGPGKLYVAATNLLNDEYVNVVNQAFGLDFFYFQAAGRHVTVGYSARF